MHEVESHLQIRFVSDELFEAANEVNPDLEDAYMYFLKIFKELVIMGLLLKEIKKLFFSKLFIVYSALVIIFGILNCQQVLNKNLHSNIYQPQNMTIYTNDSRTIMDNVTTQLEEEVKNNNFKTYQFGFLKEKRLSKEKVEKVKHLLSKMKNTNDFQILKHIPIRWLMRLDGDRTIRRGTYICWVRKA